MTASTRRLRLGIPEVSLIRPCERARFVAEGRLDCASTDQDWPLETAADAAQPADLRAPWAHYGVGRWVMASREDTPLRTVADAEGRRIAAAAAGMTRHCLADAIADVSETGCSRHAHQPEVLHGMPERTPRSLAKQESLRAPWTQAKIEPVLLLKGAIALPPAPATPSVSSPAAPHWVDPCTVVQEKAMRELIARLRAAGARGIIGRPIDENIE